jgi:TRAP-type C4-dicarboxylate transport system substrate-binding protein
VTSGHYKAAPFYALTEHVMGPEIVIMSRRAWKELSADDRAIFRAAARESTQYMREQWLGWERRSRQQALKGDVKVIDSVDRKSFVDATKSLRDELRADPKLAPLIGRIEAER